MTVLSAAVMAALLSACSKPAEKTEDIRPVRAVVLTSSSVGVNAEFAGEVRARVESRLGFRVGGKITARKVDAGTVVKKGQVLMQLDPQDLKLSQAQAKANLRAAETGRDLAKAELKRYQELRVKNFVSQAVLDAKVSAFSSAQSSVDAAQAAYFGQSNQAGYATLVSDVDGVVTAVDAEVGQVVSPGTPVVRVAKMGEKEIVIGLPEDKVEQLRKLTDVTVRLWANKDVVIPGKVREVSPVADPATRTYAVKVSIPDSAADVKLGMTAMVQFASTMATPQIKVPLTALYHEKNTTSVWVVEKGVARMVPVSIAGTSGNEVVLASGVTSGQTVVTAGVNLLKQGQKVTILPPDTSSSDPLPAAKPAPQAAAPAAAPAAAKVEVAK
ncbi:efflux RND transporter periplasmic adaptor subunit [Massilia pseudoviolaceinigra]|uniref:efflux RND transporter periplasmic adaptor subunit n=1 Tax=Massilia pseudoviolaceinigra TaxID=3057165 RepID=UPI0027966CBB|nr:efflux RND transporter periplasmic adaptor subunit [Massilia sp. CCM 9206]MDQ1922003.1 efflux RND transporter periplasmic adaptor subunit [Massilia sp. CCM 9206]